MIVPWQKSSDIYEVKEAEVETTFRVYPGEKETQDHPGCDPEVEEVRTTISVPIEFNGEPVREMVFLDGSVRDLIGDDEMERLVYRAIQQAAEDDQDAKAFAAETGWESN